MVAIKILNYNQVKIKGKIICHNSIKIGEKYEKADSEPKNLCR
jgi:hypothetical protein